MKKSELKQLIKEEIKNKKPIIQISKEEYEMLDQQGGVVISRTASGFRHSPSPVTYKRYPEGNYEIEIINPYDKSKYTVQADVTHEKGGVYLELSHIGDF